MARNSAAPRSNRQVRAGRPRDETIDRRILAAAYDELVAVGSHRFSLRAVARRADISRAALERRWSDPDALALAALEATLPPPDIPDLGDLDTELRAAARGLAASMRAPGLELQMRIVADGLTATRQLHLFQRRLLDPGREHVRAVFERARQRGELKIDADVGWLADAFIGAIFLRTTAHPSLKPPTSKDLAAIVATFGAIAG